MNITCFNNLDYDYDITWCNTKTHTCILQLEITKDINNIAPLYSDIIFNKVVKYMYNIYIYIYIYIYI